MLKFIGLFAFFVCVCNAIKVPIAIYYESLCPDSAAFITQQVYPVVKNELRDFVDIKWIPFGKSSFETRGAEVDFTCHHGPNECYGNKVHACAIEHIQSSSYQTQFTRESLTMDFINCMMAVGKNFPDNVYPGARCARENNIATWEEISHCANSTEGSILLKKHGEATNTFMNPLKNVPTIVFKEQFDNNVQERALKNFRGALCQYVPQPIPKICASENAAVSMTPIAPLVAIVGYALSRLF